MTAIMAGAIAPVKAAIDSGVAGGSGTAKARNAWTDGISLKFYPNARLNINIVDVTIPSI
jgi:hypothetical protein